MHRSTCLSGNDRPKPAVAVVAAMAVVAAAVVETKPGQQSAAGLDAVGGLPSSAAAVAGVGVPGVAQMRVGVMSVMGVDETVDAGDAAAVNGTGGAVDAVEGPGQLAL